MSYMIGLIHDILSLFGLSEELPKKSNDLTRDTHTSDSLSYSVSAI